jgi:type VI secretion system protein ImpF
MPELSQSERLQPSLLDRLTDHEPAKTMESRAQRVLSVRNLRESVVRDLLWLLNTTRFDAASRDLSSYPEVAKSVVNYGIPDLAGATASSVDPDALSRAVREAVATFEPRLNRNSLQVRAIVAEDQMAHNTLVFEIEGELWADPTPMRLLLRTELDLETGSVAIMDTAS